jgi:hypothetical protein
VRELANYRGKPALEALMEDQQKTAQENAPPPEEQELKNEELDEVSGGSGGSAGTAPGPHH